MVVHRFGEFEFDLASGRLFRGPTRIPLSEPQSAILVCLITHAGRVVPRNQLGEAGWNTETATSDSIKQSISRLRKVLGSQSTCVIETVPSVGYRFVGRVERCNRHDTDRPLRSELVPYRAFIQGRAELHTLNHANIVRARAAFEEALRDEPHYVPAHIGLANACALVFDASRIDPVWDSASLRVAVHHATRAVVLAPSSGDAWSTLAFAQYLQGAIEESAAAARKATTLEPDNWLHWLRAGFVSWGEDRIRAAHVDAWAGVLTTLRARAA